MHASGSIVRNRSFTDWYASAARERPINLRIIAHCAFDFEGDSMDGQPSFATLDYFPAQN